MHVTASIAQNIWKSLIPWTYMDEAYKMISCVIKGKGLNNA